MALVGHHQHPFFPVPGSERDDPGVFTRSQHDVRCLSGEMALEERAAALVRAMLAEGDVEEERLRKERIPSELGGQSSPLFEGEPESPPRVFRAHLVAGAARHAHDRASPTLFLGTDHASSHTRARLRS